MDFYSPHVMGGSFTPHNRLVENAAVPFLLLPSQMTLSEFYRSLIPQNGQNIQLSQPRRPSHAVTCGKCGTPHMDFNLCPANGRKCYKCRRYGHYASFCLSKERHEVNNLEDDSDAESEDSYVSAASVSPSQRLAELQTDLADSHRHTLTLKEDNARLGAKCDTLSVTNRKLEEELQDLKVSTKAELNSLSTDNVQMKTECSKMEIVIQKLNSKLEDTKTQMKSIIEENVTLKKKCETLRSQNQKQNHNLQDFAQTKSQLKSIRAEMAMLKAECETLSEEKQKIESDFQSLLSSDKEAKESIEKLNKNIEILYKYSVNIHNFMFIQSYENGKFRKEFETLIDFECQQTGNEPCKKCGSCRPHTWRGCPAKDWDCFKCKKKHNFSAICFKQNGNFEWFDTDKETEQLVQTLEKSTGIKTLDTICTESARQKSSFGDQS